MRRRCEACPPVGGPEATVRVEPFPSPLDAPLREEPGVRDVAHVAEASGGAGGELGVDGRLVGPGEAVPEPELARDADGDPPVGQREPGRVEDTADEADPPFGAR